MAILNFDVVVRNMVSIQDAGQTTYFYTFRADDPRDVEVVLDGEVILQSRYRAVPNVGNVGGRIEFLTDTDTQDPVVLVPRQELVIRRNTVIERESTFGDGLARADAVEAEFANVHAIVEELSTGPDADVLPAEEREFTIHTAVYDIPAASGQLVVGAGDRGLHDLRTFTGTPGETQTDVEPQGIRIRRTGFYALDLQLSLDIRASVDGRLGISLLRTNGRTGAQEVIHQSAISSQPTDANLEQTHENPMESVLFPLSVFNAGDYIHANISFTHSESGPVLLQFDVTPSPTESTLTVYRYVRVPSTQDAGLSATQVDARVKEFARTGGPDIALGDTDFADDVEDAVDINATNWDPQTRVLELVATDGTNKTISIPAGAASSGLNQSEVDGRVRSTDNAASDSARGNVELANQTEGRAGTDNTKAMTPLRTADYLSQQIPADQRLPDPGAGDADRALVSQGANQPPDYALLPAASVSVDASGFTGDGNLDSNVTDVQELANAVETLQVAAAPSMGGATNTRIREKQYNLVAVTGGTLTQNSTTPRDFDDLRAFTGTTPDTDTTTSRQTDGIRIDADGIYSVEVQLAFSIRNTREGEWGVSLIRAKRDAQGNEEILDSAVSSAHVDAFTSGNEDFIETVLLLPQEMKEDDYLYAAISFGGNAQAATVPATLTYNILQGTNTESFIKIRKHVNAAGGPDSDTRNATGDLVATSAVALALPTTNTSFIDNVSWTVESGKRSEYGGHGEDNLALPLIPGDSVNGLWLKAYVGGLEDSNERSATFMPFNQSLGDITRFRIPLGQVGANDVYLQAVLAIQDDGRFEFTLARGNENLPAQTRVRVYEAVVRASSGSRGLSQPQVDSRILAIIPLNRRMPDPTTFTASDDGVFPTWNNADSEWVNGVFNDENGFTWEYDSTTNMWSVDSNKLAEGDVRAFAKTATTPANVRAGIVAAMANPASDAQRLDYDDLKNKPVGTNSSELSALASLPGTSGYSLGAIINVRHGAGSVLWELAPGTTDLDTIHGIVEDRTGDFIGDDDFQWEDSPTTIQFRPLASDIGDTRSSLPNKLWIRIQMPGKDGLYNVTSLTLVSGQPATRGSNERWQYDHTPGDPGIDSTPKSTYVGRPFEVSFFSDEAMTTPVRVVANANRWIHHEPYVTDEVDPAALQGNDSRWDKDKLPTDTVYTGTLPAAPGNATTTTAGLVEKATATETSGGTADKYPDAAAAKTYLDARLDSLTLDVRTKASYDGLSTKDANTLYFTTG